MKKLLFALSMIPCTAVADIDPCLIGTWVPDMDRANETYQSFIPAPTELSGNITQTVAADGKVVIEFRDFTLAMDGLGGVTGRIFNQVNGRFDISMTTSGDEMLAEILSSDVQLKTSVLNPGGSKQTILEKPLDDTQVPDGKLLIGYTCKGDTVTVESRDTVPTFAPVWYRVN